MVNNLEIPHYNGIRTITDDSLLDVPQYSFSVKGDVLTHESSHFNSLTVSASSLCREDFIKYLDQAKVFLGGEIKQGDYSCVDRKYNKVASRNSADLLRLTKKW